MAKQTLLNFQQMRAEKSVNALTVADFDGKAHTVGAFTLDFFLEVIELQDAFSGTLDNTEVVRLLTRIKEMIADVIPTFPVGKLTFQEAQTLIEALVSSIQPDAIADAPRDAEGELTPVAG